VRADAKIAGRLSYYKAEAGPGVLGPRGWNCFSIISSSGATLYLTPGPINYENMASPITGPAIQLSWRSGETSGRFIVAQVAARVFPAVKDFVQHVIRETPASDFPFGPYPSDRLVYRGDRIVEFETPAGSEGLGTIMRLQRNNAPISGVAILKGTVPDLWLLSVRLPSDMSDLATSIIRQVEQEP